MNIDNFSFEEMKEYALSLINKLDIHQLRKAIIYLEELLNGQEGGHEKQI